MEVAATKEKTAESKNSANIQLIVFRLGGGEYGCPIDFIKEVVLTPPVTKIPLSPKHIKGVANVRGTILAVVDLEERLSISTARQEVEEKPNYLLVIESEEYKMGILVKEVPNTLSIAESAIDHSPNLIQDTGTEKGYVKGIVKSGNRLVILLDVFKLISKDEIAV